MQLVILAAGHGRRFGGLKQLAPVGPNDEAIMDYTARSALACGFDGVVLIVREEIRREIMAHVDQVWPAELAVEARCQGATPGTAQAVLSAREGLHGPFAVANADDLYSSAALSLIARHFSASEHAHEDGTSPARPHLLVGYRLAQTILSPGAVTRGLCETGERDRLERIVEHRVEKTNDGTFRGAPLGEEGAKLPLSGTELVSMNLWGFDLRMLDHLEQAIASYDHAVHQRELLLPDVVGSLVARHDDEVAVVETKSRCIGVTHKQDLKLVRAELADGAMASQMFSASP